MYRRLLITRVGVVQAYPVEGDAKRSGIAGPPWDAVLQVLRQVGVCTCAITREYRRERYTLADSDSHVYGCLVALGESLLLREEEKKREREKED